jgi:hypothetical protein
MASLFFLFNWELAKQGIGQTGHWAKQGIGNWELAKQGIGYWLLIIDY